jgi:hypothetical protein
MSPDTKNLGTLTHFSQGASVVAGRQLFDNLAVIDYPAMHSKEKV